MYFKKALKLHAFKTNLTVLNKRTISTKFILPNSQKYSYIQQKLYTIVTNLFLSISNFFKIYLRLKASIFVYD